MKNQIKQSLFIIEIIFVFIIIFFTIYTFYDYMKSLFNQETNINLLVSIVINSFIPVFVCAFIFIAAISHLLNRMNSRILLFFAGADVPLSLLLIATLIFEWIYFKEIMLPLESFAIMIYGVKLFSFLFLCFMGIILFFRKSWIRFFSLVMCGFYSGLLLVGIVFSTYNFFFANDFLFGDDFIRKVSIEIIIFSGALLLYFIHHFFLVKKYFFEARGKQYVSGNGVL